MNLQQFITSMLMHAYRDNPILAEELYVFRKQISSIIVEKAHELYPGKSYQGMDYRQCFEVFFWIGKDYHIDPIHLIKAYNMDTIPLRLEFDESYAELMYDYSF